MESWLDHLASVYGDQRFRTRKQAREVKELCDEGLVLAQWMKNSPDVRSWRGRFSGPGQQADAYVRESTSSPVINIQIVSAFDGRARAAEMVELNKSRVVTGFVGFLSQYEADQQAIVVERIKGKTAKQYPSDYWLLVGVEDSVHGLSKMPRLVNAAKVEASSSNFDRVYLVGAGKKNQIERIK